LVASKLNIEVKVWADAMEIATQTMNIAQIALQWVIMGMGHLLHTSSLRPERHHSRRLAGLPVMGNTSPLVGIGSLQIHNWRNQAIALIENWPTRVRGQCIMKRAALLSGVKRDVGQESEEEIGKSAEE
jgi:hypothetical protein